MREMGHILIRDNIKLLALEGAEEEGLPAQAVLRLVANCLLRQPNYWLRCLLPAIVRESVQAFKNRLIMMVQRILRVNEIPQRVLYRLELPIKLGGLGWGLSNPEIGYMFSFVQGMQVLRDAGKDIHDNTFFTSEGDDIINPKVPAWLKPIQDSLVRQVGMMDTDFQKYNKQAKLQQFLTNKAQQKMVADLDEQEESVAQKALRKCASARGALAWVYSAPRRGFTFTQTEYARALKLMLGLPQTNLADSTPNLGIHWSTSRSLV
jgi:hypothetical protein